MPSPRAENAQTLAGRYRVVRPLGSGGMGSVLLAEDERLGRLVAIKRLHTSSPDDALARFRREARLGASLNHPNVVSIYDSTTDEDSLLIVMEYVEGDSLKDEIRKGPLSPQLVAAIVTQIGSALDYAHVTGVIHRDVKPSNVLIGADGTAKLADLGIATATDATSITTTNDVIGTLSYIAPERLENAPDSPSADIFALAAVAFEALSGEKAQAGRTPTEIVSGRVRDLQDVWPQAPPGVADVLRDGMARDPGRRPDSAGELAARLSAVLGDEPTALMADPDATTALPVAAPLPAETDTPPAPAAPPPDIYPPPSHPEPGDPSRRRAAIVALLAAVAGIAIAAVVLSDGGGDDPAQPARQAQDQPAQTQEPAPEPEPEPEPEPPTGAELGASLNDEGFALLSAGDYAGAIATLQDAVEAFESADATGEITYAYALFNLGRALRLGGQPEQAIPILEQRLQFPNQRGVVAQELAQAQEDAGFESSGGTGSGQGNGKDKDKDEEQDEGEDGADGGTSGPGSSGGVGPGDG